MLELEYNMDRWAMEVAKSILNLIGNTPLVKLNKLAKDVKANVLVKLEYLNPSGSLKDRIAFKMIEGAEKDGSLKRGDTIVESSTGNTGIALSFVGTLKGYRVIIYETIPGKMDRERVEFMKRFGADVKLVRPELGDTTAIPGAEVELPGREICLNLERNNPNIWWARQFSNPANVAAHNETGREILAQTDRNVDAFVAAIGTGGTLMGVAEVLKQDLPSVKIVGVQPAGSRFAIVPGQPYPKSEISGGIISEMIDKDLVDAVATVSDEDAINMAHRLWKEEGLLAGISSGANVLVALREAKTLAEGKNVVTILPDSANRYLTEEHFVT
jgi:cysteine synthase A